MEYCAEPFDDLCLCAMEDLEEIEESEYRKKAEEIQSKNKGHISNSKMADRIGKYFNRLRRNEAMENDYNGVERSKSGTIGLEKTD